MASEPSDEELDPIVRKLKAAFTREQEETDAAMGKKLLTADFARFARDHGPAEFARIEQLVMARTTTINAQSPRGQTEFRHVQNTHSIDAGLFSATFDIVTNGQFQLRVSVGLASNAHQRMASLPVVNPRIWHYRACADQEGFYWLDEEAEERSTPDKIVSTVLDALSDLLIAPLEFEDEDLL
jgi:hypothetical protein